MVVIINADFPNPPPHTPHYPSVPACCSAGNGWFRYFCQGFVHFLTLQLYLLQAKIFPPINGGEQIQFTGLRNRSSTVWENMNWRITTRTCKIIWLHMNMHHLQV